ACAFFYVLPYEKDEALIEYTVFSQSRSNTINLDELILPYVHERYELLDFEPLRKEVGTIPMTTGLIPSNTDRHLRIGLAGNAAKPSSGYAFSNIQRQTAAIVRSIQDEGIPALPKARSRFQWYDKLMLTVLSEKYASGNELMWQLLSRNRPDKVFAFLSEDSFIHQEAKLFTTLPWAPFLKAVFLDWLGTKPLRPVLNPPQMDQHG
ncbi:MAG: lycopene cyclase family protein, partial [Bacteroidota bacterium]